MRNLIKCLVGIVLVSSFFIIYALDAEAAKDYECFQAKDEYIVELGGDVKEVRKAGMFGQIAFQDAKNYYSLAYRKDLPAPVKIVVPKADFHNFEIIPCPAVKVEL